MRFRREESFSEANVDDAIAYLKQLRSQLKTAILVPEKVSQENVEV